MLLPRTFRIHLTLRLVTVHGGAHREASLIRPALQGRFVIGDERLSAFCCVGVLHRVCHASRTVQRFVVHRVANIKLKFVGGSGGFAGRVTTRSINLGYLMRLAYELVHLPLVSLAVNDHFVEAEHAGRRHLLEIVRGRRPLSSVDMRAHAPHEAALVLIVALEVAELRDGGPVQILRGVRLHGNLAGDAQGSIR